MGGKDVQKTNQNFLNQGQQQNINTGLQDIFRAYQSGQGDFHGIAPNALNPFTAGAAEGLGGYAGGVGGQYTGAALGYIQNALGQNRPNIAPGVSGAVQAIGGIPAGMQQLGLTASGAYLDPYSNPAFRAGRDQLRTEFQESTLPGIDSTFTAANRGPGSGLRALQTGRAMEGLARAENTLAGDIYRQERGAQDAAAQALQAGGLAGIGQLGGLYGQVDRSMASGAGMIPGLNQVGINNFSAGLAGGSVFDDLNERMRQYGIDQWAMTNPYARAQRLMGLSQGQYETSGRSVTHHTPGAMDYLTGIGGLGLTGLGLYRAFR